MSAVTFFVLLVMATFPDNPHAIYAVESVFSTPEDCDEAMAHPDIPDGAVLFGVKCLEMEMRPANTTGVVKPEPHVVAGYHNG